MAAVALLIGNRSAGRDKVKKPIGGQNSENARTNSALSGASNGKDESRSSSD